MPAKLSVTSTEYRTPLPPFERVELGTVHPLPIAPPVTEHCVTYPPDDEGSRNPPPETATGPCEEIVTVPLTGFPLISKPPDAAVTVVVCAAAAPQKEIRKTRKATLRFIAALSDGDAISR